LDTINGMKFVLICTIRSDESGENALNSIYELYINYVKKNYMYKPGETIKIEKFDEEVRKVLKVMDEK
jgi:hypothetical protein